MSKATIETLVGFLILFMFSSQLSAQLSVTTNRSQYAPRDNISLNIESSTPSDAALDTTPLLREFVILDQKKMRINSYSEGRRTGVIRWQLLLRARKSGSLTIPSLGYQQDTSEAFSIFIKSSSPTRFLPVSDMPIILDAQVDKDDNYEGASFLYTLNIYSDRPLASGFEISPPKLQKSSVQFLDQSPVQKVSIRNKEFDVIEQRYAIFPNEMGRYVIEGPVFSGAQQDSSSTQVRANNLEINVRPRQDFDNATYWIAAQSLTITETWTKPESLKVGDIIFREVTLTAQGIPAAKLPQIITENPEIINIQDTQVSLTDKINKNGIQGTRTERQQIQLLERGELTFEAIDVFWWNTNSDTQQTAVVNKQILQVVPGANGESSIEREIAQNAPTNDTKTAVNVIQTDVNWLLWGLVGLSVISLIGWLTTLLKNKRNSGRHSEELNAEPTLPNDDLDFEAQTDTPSQPDYSQSSTTQFNAKAELSTFQLLGRACLDDDLSTATRRLIDWADQFWYEQPIESLQDIALCANDPSLNMLLAEMQELSENRQLNLWQGKSLFSLLTNIRSS